MNKIISGVSLVAALVLISGCGDSDDTKSIDDVVLTYKTTGTYDMSHYMLPAQSQKNSYIVRTFTNDKGKKDYQVTPDEETFPVNSFDVNGSTVKEYDKNDDLDTTSTISADRIRQVEDTDTIDIVKFAEKGDYIIKKIAVDEGVTIKVACKFTKQLASKDIKSVTYDDVIEVVCDTTASETGTLGGKETSATSEGTIIYHFAKGKGLISNVNEFCSKTQIGDAVATQSCEKETQEIININ